MFADIKGYTNFTAKSRLHDIVDLLRDLYQDFDKICYELKLFKVCTIGDCYFLISYQGVNNDNPLDEAVRTVKMAMMMIKILKSKNNPSLNMRIGIHTGDFSGGIIG